MTDTTELKPCPFCGGDKPFIGEARDGHYVLCPVCEIGSDVFSEKFMAENAWNNRTPEEQS